LAAFVKNSEVMEILYIVSRFKMISFSLHLLLVNVLLLSVPADSLILNCRALAEVLWVWCFLFGCFFFVMVGFLVLCFFFFSSCLKIKFA